MKKILYLIISIPLLAAVPMTSENANLNTKLHQTESAKPLWTQSEVDELVRRINEQAAYYIEESYQHGYKAGYEKAAIDCAKKNRITRIHFFTAGFAAGAAGSLLIALTVHIP